MKIIKALEPISAYGPDKLALFVGETAEIEDSFAQQLINEGKAEEFSGGGGGSSSSNVVFLDPTETAITYNQIVSLMQEGKAIFILQENANQEDDGYTSVYYFIVSGYFHDDGDDYYVYCFVPHNRDEAERFLSYQAMDPDTALQAQWAD